MEWLIGVVMFFVGLVADALRSVLVPASNAWLSRFIPSARERANLEDNKITLEIMERLQALGKDPALARHVKQNADTFLALIETQQDVFVENEIQVMTGGPSTQLEMNMEAARRADVARQQMEKSLTALQDSGWLTPPELSALHLSQDSWLTYAEAQSQFAWAGYEGGSMAPLAYWSQMEKATLTRTGELRQIFNEMQDQRG